LEVLPREVMWSRPWLNVTVIELFRIESIEGMDERGGAKYLIVIVAIGLFSHG